MSIEKTFIYKTDLDTYIRQYKSALDVLINSCETARDIEEIFFPYLYLKFNLHFFRDYLHLIYNYETLVKQCEYIDKVTSYHGLKELHTELNNILNMFKTIYNCPDYNQSIILLQNIINVYEQFFEYLNDMDEQEFYE